MRRQAVSASLSGNADKGTSLEGQGSDMSESDEYGNEQNQRENGEDNDNGRAEEGE